MIPLEIIAHILQELSPQELLLCKLVTTCAPFCAQAALTPNQVCQAFRSLVETSSALQYKIEFFFSGVTDGSLRGFTTKQKLSRVREWRAAWRNFTWDRCVTTTPLPDLWSYELAGSTFCYRRSNRNNYTFLFVRAPSTVRGIAEEERQITVSSELSNMMMYEEIQDILVVVEGQVFCFLT